MPRVVGIDHLVLSVGDLARSKAYYARVLGFLGFRLKYELGDFAGWSNGKTLFWIAQADSAGRKRKHRKGDIGFHHYAFELESRAAVDALGAFLEQHGLPVADPPGRRNAEVLPLVPAEAGTQCFGKELDARLRGHERSKLLYRAIISATFLVIGSTISTLSASCT